MASEDQELSSDTGALAKASEPKEVICADQPSSVPLETAVVSKNEAPAAEPSFVALDSLFGVERVNHGDPDEDFEWKWPTTTDLPQGVRKPVTLHLADGKVHLMAQHVWQSSLTLAEEMCDGSVDVKDKIVVELGAGAALPGIVARRLGAKHVIISDYPDQAIIDNIECNVKENFMEGVDSPATVKGFAWGTSIDTLLDALEPAQNPDLIVMADTLWLEDQHENLLTTCRDLFERCGSALRIVLTFMNHDNRRAVASHFFQLAENQFGFEIETRRTISWSKEHEDSDGSESEPDDPDKYGPVYLRVLKRKSEL
mmetsp:Transcript_18270/g.33789  ORF Transcript_18270/g.33789 Transcript_18270/m.33789 type:complete len:313 (-) Transcript_18270:981-1919(-)